MECGNIVSEEGRDVWHTEVDISALPRFDRESRRKEIQCPA